MLIYIRHSMDNEEDPTYRHDARLTHKGKKLAVSKGEALIQKYGIPNIVYCSPFRRTRETLTNLLSSVQNTQNIKIVYDQRIARHFSKNDQRHPDVAPTTLKTNIPIYESTEDFNKRIRRFSKSMSHYALEDTVVWCITHTTAYKRMASYHRVRIPSHIPFAHHFEVQMVYCESCAKYHRA